MTSKSGANDNEGKFADMFRRRASGGQCFSQPYLGCREFSAEFKLADTVADPATPIAETRDLGWMLYDMDFTNPADPKPQFFHAFLQNGVVDLAKVEVRS